jgi:transposase
MVACIQFPLADGSWRVEKQDFGTTTVDLLALSDWLPAHEISQVAMESTGEYWKLICNVLENNFEVIIMNTQHISKVLGRKTEQKRRQIFLRITCKKL